MDKKGKIAILTGGGDCPGINAVIRAVAKKAILGYNLEVIGIEDGYEGLVKNRYRSLHYDDVSGIITLGGTILGTSNIANPYRYGVMKKGKLEYEDVSQRAISNIRKLGIDCMVCIGGDGTQAIAYRLFKDGVPIVGVPKTIDNDLRGTDISFGFDSAVHVATEGIDRIHTTAQSHHRVMLVEVMGRRAGWLALHSGVASGGDVILVPEIPYDLKVVVRKVRERSRKGRRYTIVVVAEGAKPRGGDVVVKRVVKDGTDPVRLGGIGFVLGDQIEKATGIETRTVVLGHLQRGGIPTAFDRVLATQLGTKAMDMVANGSYGYMAAMKNGALAEVSLEEVAGGSRNIPADDPLVQSARAVGTCFGDRM